MTPATLQWLDQALRLLVSSVGDQPIDSVTPQMISAWHNKNMERVAVTTANGYLRAVKIVFNRLLDRGLVGANPAYYVAYAPQPRPRPRAVKVETYRAMRAAAGVRDRAFLDLLWASGARLGGLLSMSLATLELWREAGRACLAVEVKEKGGRSRFVYAADAQAEAVADWLQIRPFSPSPTLFITSTGKPLSRPGAHSVMRKLRIAAGVADGDPANAHAFRHAFAIRQLDAGHDLATVSAWLGHADPAFTARVYAVRREDQLRAKYFGNGQAVG